MTEPSAMASIVSLPHPLVELIVAMAALTAPQTSTILHLARILPPTQVPLAYATILRAANRYAASSGLIDDPNELVDPTCKRSIGYPANDVFLSIDQLMSSRKSALFRPIFMRMFPHLTCHSGAQSNWAGLDNVARCCAYLGDVGLLQRLLDLGTDMRACERVMDAASEAGHVHVLQWFLDSKLVVAGVSYSDAAAPLAALNDHAHVLDWWRANGAQIGIKDDFFTESDVVAHACARTHLAVLDWLHQHFESIGDNQDDWTRLTMGWVHATESGQVGVLEWLKANKIPFPQSGSGVQTWIDYACQDNCIEVLDWWYNNTDRKHYSFKAVEWAATIGRLDVLKWWAAKQDLVFKYSPNALRMASLHGHMHVLDWFASKVPSFDLLTQPAPSAAFNPTQTVPPLIPRDIATLVAFGRADYIECLGYTPPSCLTHALDGAPSANYELIVQVFAAALSHGHVSFLQHYFRAFQLMTDSSACDLGAAVASNQVATLVWCEHYFAEWFAQATSDDDDWSRYACEAIEYRADQVLSWIFTTGKLDAPKPVSLLPLLSDACFLADSHILNMVLAKIVKSCPQDLDILKTDDSPMTILASMGHISGLEWWSSNNLPVARSTLPIDYANKRGKLAVLVWWYTCSDWPFLWSEAAIRWAVEFQHVKVMKWWLRSGLVKDQDLLGLLREGMGE